MRPSETQIILPILDSTLTSILRRPSLTFVNHLNKLCTTHYMYQAPRSWKKIKRFYPMLTWTQVWYSDLDYIATFRLSLVMVTLYEIRPSIGIVVSAKKIHSVKS